MNPLCSYNAILSMLLDKHYPTITKTGSHSNNSWYTSYLQASDLSVDALSELKKVVYREVVDHVNALSTTALEIKIHSFKNLQDAPSRNLLIFAPVQPGRYKPILSNL